MSDETDPESIQDATARARAETLERAYLAALSTACRPGPCNHFRCHAMREAANRVRSIQATPLAAARFDNCFGPDPEEQTDASPPPWHWEKTASGKWALISRAVSKLIALSRSVGKADRALIAAAPEWKARALAAEALLRDVSALLDVSAECTKCNMALVGPDGKVLTREYGTSGRRVMVEGTEEHPQLFNPGRPNEDGFNGACPRCGRNNWQTSDAFEERLPDVTARLDVLLASLPPAPKGKP